MITISICMIVKNEEKILSRCLDSLKGLSDEIIIVDTGSSDDTKKIAKKYTDKIYNFKWNNNFSDARNFSFSKCTKDYIYVADADEYIDEENRQKFLNLKNNLLPEIEIVQMYYENRTPYESIYNFDKELRPKLFKRLRNFRWVDQIHETVTSNPIIYDSDINIIHMPQSSHVNRDLSIIRDLIAKKEVLSDKIIMLYMRELWKAGEKNDILLAQEYISKILEDEGISLEKRQIARCILARCARIKNDLHLFFKQSLDCMAESPCSEICCEIGKYFQKTADIKQDKNEFKEAISWYQNAILNVQPCMDIKSCGITPLESISKCFESIGDFESAAEYQKKADEWTLPQI